MSKAAHFEAKKHAYRQTQDGIVISFVVHPNDVAAALATAPLGTRYMVAFAEIGENEQPVSSTDKPGPSKEAVPEKGKRRFDELPRSQQCALRCADPAFRGWLGFGSEDDAAEYVRKACGIRSRAELDSNDSAVTAWLQIENAFMEETGRMAEVRG